MKPTDRNTYLPYISAHPKHCMKGLPYGQFLRIRRICTRTTDFEKHAARKAGHLLQHNYTQDLLLNSFMQARNKDRIELLTRRSTETPDDQPEKIFLTTCYNQNYGGLRDQVKSTWDLLGRSCSTRFIRDKNLIVGYRRPKNERFFDESKTPHCTHHRISTNRETRPREVLESKLSLLHSHQHNWQDTVRLGQKDTYCNA